MTHYTAEDERQALASMIEEGKRLLDIAEDGPSPEPSTYSGDQGGHDIRAVQLRPENFSPKMIEKAGRLYVAGNYRPCGDQAFQVQGDSGDWHPVRVWGSLVWLATCPCAARASRWNRAGACSHRLVGAYLRAQIIDQAIPRWPFLTLTMEETS